MLSCIYPYSLPALPRTFTELPPKVAATAAVAQSVERCSRDPGSAVQLATFELRKRPGNSDDDNGSRDCFRGQAFCLRPLKQSHDALPTSLHSNLP